MTSSVRGAMADKAPKAWALPRFWISIRSYKKQPVKKVGQNIGHSLAKICHGVPATVIIVTQPSGHSREFTSRELDSITWVYQISSFFVAFMKYLTYFISEPSWFIKRYHVTFMKYFFKGETNQVCNLKFTKIKFHLQGQYQYPKAPMKMGKLNKIVIVNKTKCYVDLALTDMQ